MHGATVHFNEHFMESKKSATPNTQSRLFCQVNWIKMEQMELDDFLSWKY